MQDAHIQAIEGGDIATVQTLLKSKKLDVNAKSSDGFTPLHLAVYEGQFDMVELLLNQGAKINEKSTHDEESALHMATECGDYDMVEYLLEKGANVNAQDVEGFTPLHVAAEHGFDEICELLIEYDANVDIKNKNGDTPLHVACDYGKLNVVKILIEVGEANVDAVDAEGSTPLQIAKQNNHLLLMKYLIEAGASDIDDAKFNLRTPLHDACLSNNFTLVRQIVEQISKTAKSKHIAMNPEDSSVSVPLHYACMRKNLLMSKYLIENGANVNAMNDEKWTPLRIAIKLKEKAMVQMLLHERADIDKHSLLTTVEANNVDILRMLMKKGADVHYKGFQAAFQNAVAENKVELVKAFVDGGANIDAVFSEDFLAKIPNKTNASIEFLQSLKKFSWKRSESVSEMIFAYSFDSLVYQLTHRCGATKPVSVEYLFEGKFWHMHGFEQLPRRPVIMIQVVQAPSSMLNLKFKDIQFV